jgi:hypothetical protein
MSFFLLAPAAIFMEGVKFTPAYLQSAVSISFVKVDRIVVSQVHSIYYCVEIANMLYIIFLDRGWMLDKCTPDLFLLHSVSMRISK